MDWDERVELYHRGLCEEWMGRFREKREVALPRWISSFRNGYPCRILDNHFGSFNWSCSLRFDDGEEWLVRFAVPGKVMDGDAKVVREVATMQLIKEKTSIPVPAIHGWGQSKDNSLGLGPFIIMNFIRGESLGKLWQEELEGMDVLKSDICERDLQTVYRQIAGFLLDLSRLEFPQAGSLSSKGNDIIANLGPLTLKMQEIEAHGGVKVGGCRSKTFSSATEYFHYVAEQDIQHLQEQPNSIDNTQDARAKYKFRNQFKSIIPLFITENHDRSPFKLICDDMRLGNMLVNNAIDLKIVAVLDWEWAYTAPLQMFYSPPRWLLIKKPTFWNDSDLHRYRNCLEIFLRELKLEEGKRNDGYFGPQQKLSNLMRQSMTDGKFWFHELIYTGYEGADNSAWNAICKVYSNINELAPIQEAVLDAFTSEKLRQLEAYNADWSAIRAERDHKEAELNSLIVKYAPHDDKIAAWAKERGLLGSIEDTPHGRESSGSSGSSRSSQSRGDAC